MKINKIYITVLFLMAALFVGCDDFEDNVEQSPTVSADNPAVCFTSENANEFNLEPAIGLEFELTLTRDDETAALEVPMAVITNTENSFVIPSSVSFAAGSKTATISISMADGAPKGKSLDFAIQVDESFSNPYKIEYGTYYGSAYISDWEQYATGTYYSWWYEENFAQVLEYSPVLDQYRFRDLMSEGYHFVFTWDGATNIVPVPDKIETGYVHSSYGMVSATTNAATYDAATKKFTFTRKWTVDAGSFGEGDDTYTMD